MHPPAWVCERLVRQAPLLRLGWAGHPPTQVGALNCGKFALISLYPANTYWREDLRNRFFGEFWSLTTQQLKYGDGRVKQTVFAHRERGPIFNKRGTTEPDWDPIARIPVYLQDLSIEQVMYGRVAWQIPLAQKLAKQTKRERAQAARERKEQTVKQARSIISDAAEDIAKEMWYNANKIEMPSTANINRDYSHIEAVKEGHSDAVITADDVA